MTFAEKAIAFNRTLKYTGDPLPDGVAIMNPFRDSPQAVAVSEQFYRKYYNDHNERYMIWGINPGRFGAGLTGIPFTDPKRLLSACEIPYEGKSAHEPSSEFVYEVIAAFGGCDKFYRQFYINSPSPLGYTFAANNTKPRNYNYYDSRELMQAVRKFMIESMRQLMSIGLRRDICFCFGSGKNEVCLNEINSEFGFFDRLVALEHPRYIMQYKHASKGEYIQKYLAHLRAIETAATVSMNLQ